MHDARSLCTQSVKAEAVRDQRYRSSIRSSGLSKKTVLLNRRGTRKQAKKM